MYVVTAINIGNGLREALYEVVGSKTFGGEAMIHKVPRELQSMSSRMATAQIYHPSGFFPLKVS